MRFLRRRSSPEFHRVLFGRSGDRDRDDAVNFWRECNRRNVREIDSLRGTLRQIAALAACRNSCGGDDHGAILDLAREALR